MSNRLPRRRVMKHSNPHLAWSSYAQSLQAIETSMHNLTSSIIRFQQAMPSSMTSSNRMDDFELKRIRYDFMLNLQSLHCLQTQLLQKFQLLWETGHLEKNTLTNNFFNKINEEELASSARFLLYNPKDLRQIRNWIRLLNQFEQKKRKIAYPFPSTSVSVPPWLNQGILDPQINKKR